MKKHVEVAVLCFLFSEDFKQVLLSIGDEKSLGIPGAYVSADDESMRVTACRGIQRRGAHQRPTVPTDWSEFARMFCDGRERGLPHEYEIACFWATSSRLESSSSTAIASVALVLSTPQKFEHPEHHWLLAMAHGIASGRSRIMHFNCEEMARKAG